MIGITAELKKIPIGLKEGDTENSEVVRDLLSTLQDRGFSLACDKLLAVVDGSKALKKGLQSVFGERLLIQRCYLHIARNICGYLPKQFHKQLNWIMKRLMNLKSLSLKQRKTFSPFDTGYLRTDYLRSGNLISGNLISQTLQ